MFCDCIFVVFVLLNTMLVLNYYAPFVWFMPMYETLLRAQLQHFSRVGLVSVHETMSAELHEIRHRKTKSLPAQPSIQELQSLINEDGPQFVCFIATIFHIYIR